MYKNIELWFRLQSALGGRPYVDDETGLPVVLDTLQNTVFTFGARDGGGPNYDSAESKGRKLAARYKAELDLEGAKMTIVEALAATEKVCGKRLDAGWWVWVMMSDSARDECLWMCDTHVAW